MIQLLSKTIPDNAVTNIQEGEAPSAFSVAVKERIDERKDILIFILCFDCDDDDAGFDSELKGIGTRRGRRVLVVDLLNIACGH